MKDLFDFNDEKRVLDPCCGSKMFWKDRKNKDAVFGDKRKEFHTLCDGRTLNIDPDLLMDFTEMPFPNESFNLVVFDPPHLTRAGPKSWMAAKYGKLSDNWKEDMRKGFGECFRVLAENGTLVFKWNETQIKTKELLSLCDVDPLFGHFTGHKGFTHWYVFIKPKGKF